VIEDSDFVAVYSPGRDREKKKAEAIMSASMTRAGSSLLLAINYYLKTMIKHIHAYLILFNLPELGDEEDNKNV
jgi:hypothetical protein